MEKIAKGSFDLGFTSGFSLLTLVAVTIVISSAPPAALTAWLLLSEIVYLCWAASGERPHRGEAAAFAFRMNIQAAVRVAIWLMLAVILMVAASMLPSVTLTSVFGAFDANGDVGASLGTMMRLAVAASIALAAVRLKRIQMRGITFRSLADGSYCKQSVRVEGTLSETSNALAEHLLRLAAPNGPAFKRALRSSRVQVLCSEEDGRPLNRLYFSGFPVRATISMRQIDHHHTDLRIWYRLRGGYLLSELFANPVDVAMLGEFLDETVLAPVKLSLDRLAVAAA